MAKDIVLSSEFAIYGPSPDATAPAPVEPEAGRIPRRRSMAALDALAYSLGAMHKS
jgi:hypothetical protein